MEVRHANECNLRQQSEMNGGAEGTNFIFQVTFTFVFLKANQSRLSDARKVKIIKSKEIENYRLLFLGNFPPVLLPPHTVLWLRFCLASEEEDKLCSS